MKCDKPSTHRCGTLDLPQTCVDAGDKVRSMADEKKSPHGTEEYVHRLALKTGVTDQQVREIIAMVGYDQSSIIREARIIANGKNDNGRS